MQAVALDLLQYGALALSNGWLIHQVSHIHLVRALHCLQNDCRLQITDLLIAQHTHTETLWRSLFSQQLGGSI